MKIAVLDDYQDVFRRLPRFGLLAGHEVVVHRDTEKDADRLVARLADCDAVVLHAQRTAMPRAVIECLPRLKLVAQAASLKDHLDIVACTERGILVAAVPAGIPWPTAELTWALILASVRHLPFEVEQLKRGRWQSTVGTELRGRTLGIYSFGKIGRCVAEVGRAFGMKVVCWGRASSLESARAARFDVAPSREAFFAGVDVLSLNLRYNAETHAIVTAADLGLMKPTALFVNTSRARLVADGALVEALWRGRPGFAAVDVYEDEPVLGAGHPLLGLPNVLCTPHLGGATQAAYERQYDPMIDALVAFAAGTPMHIVNPEACGWRRTT
ncbi:MAG: D-2-hydroxyacid dehydrogenase family protein [Burkholderiales bacterium]|nr:D-2-hydroxyacid dehydrogenase family protein [Burkholderiales bacterium]